MHNYILNEAGQAEILRAGQKDQSFTSSLTQVGKKFLMNIFKLVGIPSYFFNIT